MLTTPRILIIAVLSSVCALGYFWWGAQSGAPQISQFGDAVPSLPMTLDNNSRVKGPDDSASQSNVDVGRAAVKNVPSKHSQDLRELILSLKTNEELDAIFQQIMSQSLSWDGRSDLIFLLEHWLGLDAMSSLEHALLASKQWQSFDILYQILELASGEDFVDTQAWLSAQTIEQSQMNEAVTALYIGLAKKDPTTAANYLANITSETLRERITSSLVENWARIDAREAMMWLNSQSSSDTILSNKALVIYQVIESDLPLAGEFLAALPPGEQKTVVASSYAHRLAEDDMDAALAWAEALAYGNDPAYALAMASVLEVLAQDPQGAWDALEYAMAEDNENSRDDLLNSVALHIAAREPAALAERLYELPESSRADIATKIARAWAGKDAGKLASWINSLAPGEIRDAAKQPMIEHYMNPAPDHAFRLALSMDSPENKTAMLEAVISHWRTLDAQAAKDALVNASGLDDSERARLLEISDAASS